MNSRKQQMADAQGRPPKNTLTAFSPRLMRQRMDEAEFTVADLVCCLHNAHGIHNASIIGYLDGHRRPGPEALHAIAAVLSCRMEDLMEPREAA